MAIFDVICAPTSASSGSGYELKLESSLSFDTAADKSTLLSPQKVWVSRGSHYHVSIILDQTASLSEKYNDNFMEGVGKAVRDSEVSFWLVQ
jgi:hypothetical protein